MFQAYYSTKYAVFQTEKSVFLQDFFQQQSGKKYYLGCGIYFLLQADYFAGAAAVSAGRSGSSFSCRLPSLETINSPPITLTSPVAP